ncbi:MAG: hypothetical protein EOO13_00260 [Chitinophagaceae bacterium]|nr:MAG: hypothetical protein EOO13_00260 [Chitinophagaceae bacterium]
MNKVSVGFMICYCSVFFTSCTPSPEKYFDVAVLNSNMLVGFANRSLSREMEMPTARMNTDGKTTAMSRKAVIEDKIVFSKKVLSDIKGLPKSSDANEIISSALKLYGFVIPAYEGDYLKLAEMYDNGAAAEEIRSFDDRLKDKYSGQFQVLFNDLISKGKLYAARHKIEVNWAE